MNSVFFLVLRRMRAPLLLISTVYAIATLGLTIIPGVDDQGNPWHMDFFHAFYFVSFMGTTIGFGEIPYPFTDAQRLWTLVFIYITVAVWIYTIGTLIKLVQDEALQRAITHYQFSRSVKKIRDPFYLICGFGATGRRLIDTLDPFLIQSTVIELVQEKIDALSLGEHTLLIPRLAGDAGKPENLILGGVQHPCCSGVVALTDDNNVNLHIAITAKVMNPNLKVISRADSHEVEENMRSFGTDYIIDPFDIFAERLATALHSPNQYQLDKWMRNVSSTASLQAMEPLTEGTWILCGYGRFGKAIYRRLMEEGLKVKVIEPFPEKNRAPTGTIKGWGTDAETLEKANIHEAVGIVAGADNDSNNLSIIVTARDLNPDVFAVVRECKAGNDVLFKHVKADIIMAPSDILASKVNTLITNPLVDDFLSLAGARNDSWSGRLLWDLRQLSKKGRLILWELTINTDSAYAVVQALIEDQQITIADLKTDHRDRSKTLPAMALLHENSSASYSLPENSSQLSPGDRLLFVGTSNCLSCMRWTLQNIFALEYVLTGEVRPQTFLGKQLFE